MLETHGLQLTSLVAQLEESFLALILHLDGTQSLIVYRSGQRCVVERIQHQFRGEKNGS